MTKTYGSLLPSLSSQLRILMQELNGAVTVLPISTKTLLRQRVCGVANLRRRGFDLHTYIYTHTDIGREREKLGDAAEKEILSAAFGRLFAVDAVAARGN